MGVVKKDSLRTNGSASKNNGGSMQFGKPDKNSATGDDDGFGLNRSQTQGGMCRVNLRQRGAKKSRINIMPTSKYQDGIDFNELTSGNGSHGDMQSMQTMDP